MELKHENKKREILGVITASGKPASKTAMPENPTVVVSSLGCITAVADNSWE